VARRAIDASVCPGEGKEGRIVELGDAPTIVPAAGRVAILTTISELSTVGIQMAVGTGGWHVRKNEALMAGRTIFDPVPLV